MNETEKKELQEKLCYKKESVYAKSSPEKIDEMFSYAEGYKNYLDAAKTEREAVNASIALAEKNGFTAYRFGDALKPGDKKYFNNRGKGIFLFRIGTAPIMETGIRILAAHIDSPRLDLKQVPLYEDSGMSFLKTHYYGGVKKYQWTAIPLALHGVVVKKDGTTVDICVGENESDPVFYINDLLPHLSAEQSQKPLGSAIPGENLNVLVGSRPIDDDTEGAIKLNVLRILNEMYGITEEDFLSAEISAVPAFKARDVGFDRALIGSYGHDDRVCAYPALTAIFETDSDRTILSALVDKEEIGSEGVSGMQSAILKDLMDAISRALSADPAAVRMASACLSADVNAAYDPNFAEVYEKRNSAILSCGTTMSKYTGSRGKAGTSDASAEVVGMVRRIFDENGVVWQTSELGKIDIGGGGTVAKYIANLNIDTVDMGVPVISMHAPYEVVAKVDVYTTHEAFVAFCK